MISEIAAAAAMVAGSPGNCERRDDFSGCSVEEGELFTLAFSRRANQNLARMLPPQPVGTPPARPVVWYEFATVPACGGNQPGDSSDDNCTRMGLCRAQGISDNYLMFVYRREATAEGPRTRWERIGETCFDADVPPASAGAGAGGPGTELIVQAFHAMPLAKATAHVQPPGGRVLVNLPTYFKAGHAAAGFGPGEVDSLTLGGTPVRIRPRAQAYTYRFGDGQTLGPTSSPGGVYPDGDITHTYLAKASVNARIDTTYAADYSIDGGAWRPIPGTVTITGQPVTLQVLTARSRLVQGDD